MKYKVIGGEWKDTNWTDLLPGKREEYGPFDTYQEAKNKWHQRSWQTVDDCHCRFLIEEIA